MWCVVLKMTQLRFFVGAPCAGMALFAAPPRLATMINGLCRALAWGCWLILLVHAGGTAPTAPTFPVPTGGSRQNSPSTSTSAVARLPEVTVNVPSNYLFKDSFFMSVGGSSNVFVQIEEPVAGQFDAVGTQVVVVRDLSVLTRAAAAGDIPDATNPLLQNAVTSFRGSSKAGCVHELSMRGVRHALKFTVDTDSLQRRVLVLLRAGDRERDVVASASAFLSAC